MQTDEIANKRVVLAWALGVAPTDASVLTSFGVR
jgi:hypothetical protein